MPTNTELFFQIFNLSKSSYFLDRLMIFGANELIFITFFISFLLIILGKTKERRAFLFIVPSIIFAEILIKGTHLFFIEPRPYVTLNLVPLISHTPDAAFPSEHTTMMATAAFAYLFNKSKYTLLFIFLMLWVGLSRIYVGVHYPLDILGGIAYGFFANSITCLINKKIKLF